MEQIPLLCSEILKELLVQTRGDDVVLPDCIVSDSRKLAGGCLFIAVPGSRCDGHDFIPEAEKLAAVIVHSQNLAVYHPSGTKSGVAHYQ